MNRFLKRALTVPAALIAVISWMLILCSAADHLAIGGPKAVWYGLDFVPALWLLLLALIGAIALWLLGHRRIAMIGAFLSLGYFIAFGDLSAAPLGSLWSGGSSPGAILSVTALNVRYYSEGFREVMDAIRTMNADVVLLSENTMDSTQVAELRSLLPGYTYCPGHPNSTAILSRLHILSFREIDLPSHEASLSGGNDVAGMSSHPHRSFTHAQILFQGTPVNVVSIRFIAGRPKDHTWGENVKWGRYLVEEQRAEVAAFTKYLAGLHGPIVFGGDLNAPPRSKTLKPLEAIAHDAYLSDHFWGDLTFRTEFPTLRLDYLFGMNGAVPVRSRVVRVVVSDHFPVSAEFRLEEQPERMVSQRTD